MAKRIYGGNSGYQGYSKSKRAVMAESNGLRNKSQMNATFKNEVNAILAAEGLKPVTLKQIKDNLSKIRPTEWHHTSKFGNRTDYWSSESVANYFIYNTDNTASRTANKSDDIKRAYEQILANVNNCDDTFVSSPTYHYVVIFNGSKDVKKWVCKRKSRRQKYDDWRSVSFKEIETECQREIKRRNAWALLHNTFDKYIKNSREMAEVICSVSHVKLSDVIKYHKAK